MMTIAKKIVLALFCVQAISLTACADKEKIITIAELPAAAQTFVQKHFGKSNVSVVKKEMEILETSYDVVMKDGSKIEFDKKGVWTEVKCRNKAVPAAIVPKNISECVKKNYPNVSILSIEKDRTKTEVTLSNKLELTFNKQGALIDIDD